MNPLRHLTGRVETSVIFGTVLLVVVLMIATQGAWAGSRDEKVTVLLVEQNSRMALSISNRAYAMSTGSVVLSGNSKDLMGDDRIKAAYLGGDL